MLEDSDKEYERGLLTRKMEAGEDVVIESDRAAVLRNVTCPKAQYHYVVLPKEDIENVTALRREHLPLLDHMMELANQTIEKQNHLPSSSFLVGFKIESFMNRLNMHVISNDFVSDTMRHVHHWNTFNTDLFLTFQACFALLNLMGSIEPLTPERAAELRSSIPVHCNQCKFITKNFAKFKDHLRWHWQRRENERTFTTTLSQLNNSFGNISMNDKDNSVGNRPNIGPRPRPQNKGAQGGAATGVNTAHQKPFKKWHNMKSKNNNNISVKNSIDTAYIP